MSKATFETGTLYWIYWGAFDKWFIALAEYQHKRLDYYFHPIFNGFGFWYEDRHQHKIEISEQIKSPKFKAMKNKLTKKEQWMLNFLKEKFETDPTMSWSPSVIGHEYGRTIGKPWLHSSAASPTLIKLAEKGLVERNINQGWYRYKPQEDED